MNKRIKKKKAFSVVNEATEFTLRKDHPKTFIKKAYKLMKDFNAKPEMFMKRGQRFEKFSKLTREEQMLMWRTPASEKDLKKQQAILNKYGKDVVFLSDEAFEKVMAIRKLKGLSRKKNRRKINNALTG